MNERIKFSVLFLRHADTLPAGPDGDEARILSPKGIERAQAAAKALADEDLDLVITTGVARTQQTGAIIAGSQKTLKDIISRRSLYLPMDPDEAAAVVSAFEANRTAKALHEKAGDDACRKAVSHCIRTANTVIGMAVDTGAKNILFASHDGMIQTMIFEKGYGSHLDSQTVGVLDIPLGPCDGIRVDFLNDLACGYEVFRSPQID